MKEKFKIVNIVAVQNAGFYIDMDKLGFDDCISSYDNERFPGAITKIKGTKGKVTVFHNGNLISVGTRSVKQAKEDLEIAIKYLKKFKKKRW